MKSTFITLVLYFCVSVLFGQTIDGYEYWFDQNDSDMERVFVPVASTSFLNVTNESINYTLDAGIHRIHFRMKQSNGAWSAVCHRDFLVMEEEQPNLMAGYEYWFDQDDANRTYVAATPQEMLNLQNQTFYYPVDMTSGVHQLCIRTKDIHGKWSSVAHRRVYITPPPFEVKITRFRYWSDQVVEDPSDMTVVELPQPVTYLDLSNHVDFCEFETAGITTVFFQMQDNRGYWSAVNSRSTTIDQIITTPELAEITGQNEICENSIASYIANAAGASWFEWILPSGWIGASDSSQIDLNANTSGGIITVIPHNNCGAGVSQNFNVATIPATVPSVEISTNDFPACLGTEVNINAISSNGGDQPTFIWLVNGVSIGSTNTPEIITTGLSMGDQIVVELISSATCITSDTVSSSGLVADISDIVVPEVSLVASDLEICEGEEITFTAAPLNNSGGDSPTYQWFVNDVPEIANQSTFSSSDMSDGDQVSVTMTSNALCATPEDATSTINSITVFPLPSTPVITQEGDVLNSSSATGNQWYFNNELIDGATASSYTATAAGEYYVIVTSVNGCASSTSNTIDFVIGVDENVFNQLSLFPNPFRDQLNLKSNESTSIDMIRIVDSTGRIILIQERIPSSHTIDTSDWAAGLYLMQLTSNGKLKEFRLSKI